MDQQMFIQLVKLLEEVKDTQRVHTRMLTNLLKQKEGVEVLTVPEGAVFPLNTVEDVEAMCAKLGDVEFNSAVVITNLFFTSISIF